MFGKQTENIVFHHRHTALRLAGRMADVNENSSDVVLLDGPEETVHLSPLSPELMDEWQRNKPGYGRLHFMKHLLTTGRLADVTFILKQEGGGNPENILAHKSILKFKSEFFTSFFSERWKNDECNLMDAQFTSGDFKSFLEFLYLGQTTINSQNVLALYYLANLYQIPELRCKCEAFLQQNIDEENALTLFTAVFLQDSRQSSFVLQALLDFICENGEAMLEKSEMLEFNEGQLSLIFSRGQFKCLPKRILRFCIRWAAKNFGKKKLQQFSELDKFFRTNLSLRFVSDLPYLASLLDYYELNTNDPTGNGNVQLKPVKPDAVYEMKRLPQIEYDKQWVYRRNRADRVSFRCTESILLTGIGLYGDRMFGGGNFGKRYCPEEDAKPAKYHVDVRVHEHGKSFKELMFAYRGAGTDMEMGHNSSCIYKVEFKPLYLQANEWYTISVKITGPGSYYGKGGEMVKLIRCGNLPVIFEFQEASSKDEQANLSNPTGVPVGQIPKLFFKLADPTDDEDEIEILP